jgi:hypothetical protein
MRRIAWGVLAALAGLACGPWAGPARGEGGKGTVVDLDGLKSAAPASWKEEAPANKMRLAQFQLPRAGDDRHDAEVVIFKNAGGSVRDNVARWKGMFTAPEGKTIDDVSKVEDIKIAGRPATRLDVRGTYTFKTRPFDPSDKGEKRPDYRMVAVQFEGPQNLYHIRLVGPAATVEMYQKGFDDWLKGFK